MDGLCPHSLHQLRVQPSSGSFPPTPCRSIIPTDADVPKSALEDPRVTRRLNEHERRMEELRVEMKHEREMWRLERRCHEYELEYIRRRYSNPSTTCDPKPILEFICHYLVLWGLTIYIVCIFFPSSDIGTNHCSKFIISLGLLLTYLHWKEWKERAGHKLDITDIERYIEVLGHNWDHGVLISDDVN